MQSLLRQGEQQAMAHCRACGSAASEAAFRVGDCVFFQCQDCTHVFLPVSHTEESIQEIYREYGRSPARKRGRNEYFCGIQERELARFGQDLRRGRQLLASGAKSPRLLDIGCGNGALISRALSLGFAADGLEISEPLANFVEERYGCRVFRDFVWKLDLPPASYDLIAMCDVIEHLTDPERDLRYVFRLLKPGGVLYLITPNERALLRSVAKGLFWMSGGRVRKPMERLYYNHHLSYFTRDSLERLLGRVGFSILSITTRNQEIMRLKLSSLQRMGVRLIWAMGELKGQQRGKWVVFGGKPAARERDLRLTGPPRPAQWNSGSGAPPATARPHARPPEGRR